MSSVMQKALGRKKGVRKDKLEKVEKLFSYLKEASLVVVVSYQGNAPSLTVNQITQLRKNLRENEGIMVVAKNTLLKLALKKANVTELDDFLKGPNALIIGYDKSIEVLKSLFDFVKSVEKETGVKLPEVKAGYFEGQFYDTNKLYELSKLPSKEQLLGQLVGGLKSPLTGLVSSLSGIIRKFAIAIDQLREKKEKEAA